MTYRLADFPFRKRRPLRFALAEALAKHVRGLSFDLPKSATPFRFGAVFDTWAEFAAKALIANGTLPAAAVLPDNPKDDAASFTPRILEDTWRPEGEPGFVLQEIAQIEVPMLVVVRAADPPEREAILSTFEDAFIEPDVDESDVRSGIWLELGAYYARRARFTLAGPGKILDDEETVQKNRWMATFEILAQASHVRVVPAVPFFPRTPLEVDGTSV